MPHPSAFRPALIALVLLGAGLLLAWAGDSRPTVQAPTHVVKVSGLGFQPATLTVHSGDRVTWLNDDLIVHTVTAADHGFDSGDLPAGKSWTFVARKRGTFRYACRYHANMTGTLIVQ